MGWFLYKLGNNDELLLGDELLDILGDALEKIIVLYKRDVGRVPYIEEVIAGIGMVSHPHIEDKTLLVDETLTLLERFKEHANYEKFLIAVGLAKMADTWCTLTPSQADSLIEYVAELNDAVKNSQFLAMAYYWAAKYYRELCEE